jgi:hypothetical protein
MVTIFYYSFAGVELRGTPPRHNAKLAVLPQHRLLLATLQPHCLSSSLHCRRIYAFNAQLSVPVPPMLGRRAISMRMAYSWTVLFS